MRRQRRWRGGGTRVQKGRLQLDIDELLYFPRAVEREDARAFFDAVPRNVDLIAFHNHEVLPCESLECDWFDCTLFKVSQHMLADYRGSEVEDARASRMRRARDGETIDPHAIGAEGSKALGGGLGGGGRAISAETAGRYMVGGYGDLVHGRLPAGTVRLDVANEQQ